MVKVLIVDDQRVAREYMEKIVSESKNYELTGSLSNADMATVVCNRSDVNLVLMDVCTRGLEDGITAAANLRQQFPEIKIIIVTSMPEASYIKRAREAGVDSFWHKDSSSEKLITVMDATMNGEHIWPCTSPAVKLGAISSDNLSDVEIDILRLVCEGFEYNEIAERTFYSRDTVKYHICNILRKTGYANKTQLAIAATSKHFIVPKLDNQDAGDINAYDL